MIQRLEDKGKAGIYVILNNINSKRYVGKSKNIYHRIMQHVTYLNTKCKDENRHLINAWHKYGKENFSYYVVEYLDDEDPKKLDKMLAERELYWMMKLETLDRNKGYNLRYDSQGRCFVQDETRQKLKEAHKRRFSDSKEREKLSILSKEMHIKYADSFEKARRKLAISRRKYRIAKCDKITGNIIKIYDTVMDILTENPTYYRLAIKGCCYGSKKSYKGFQWHYCDLNSDNLIVR